MGLKGNYKKYLGLLDKCSFKDKIEILKDKPYLSQRRLHGLIDIYPCCWGTTVWLTDAGEKVKELWQKAGHDPEDFDGDEIVCIRDQFPGYVGRKPMQLFLDSLIETEQRDNSIVAFSWKTPKSKFKEFGLRHSGLCLGNYKGKDIMFHHIGYRYDYEFISIDNFVRFRLSKESRSTLDIKYYEVPMIN